MDNANLIPAEGRNSCPVINCTDDANKPINLRHIVKPDVKYNGVRSVNVTSDNKFLIFTSENSIPRIRVVDLEKLEFLHCEYKGHGDSVRLTSITSDNKAFHTASWDGSSRRFEIESGKCSRIISGFGRSPSCFLDPDQKFLFTASYDSDFDLESKNNGRCWDLSSGKIISMYKHTRERISPESIDIVYEKGKVYTGSDDGCAFQWNLKGKQPIIKYFSFKGSVRKLAVSANYIAASCTDGIVRVHFKTTGEYYRYFRHIELDIRDVRISRDETKLWSASETGSVSCFNLITGETIFHKKIHSLWIWSICLMNNEKVLVTGSGDGSVAFLSAQSGYKLAQLHNLSCTNDILVTSPNDQTFPAGFFYTTNTDLIRVVEDNKMRQKQEILVLNDPRRKAYINKLNLKNLIITKLKNEKYYASLTENYLQHKKVLDQIKVQELPFMLKSKS